MTDSFKQVQKIAVYGAGGFGLEVAMLIEQINAANPSWEMIGYFDDKLDAGKVVNGYPVLGGISDLNCWKEPLAVTLGLGIPQTREAVFNSITNSMVSYPTLVHPSVIMGNPDLCRIGRGSIICAGSVLTTNYDLGEQVVVNINCTVGHEVTIKSFSALMPSCSISGEVIIEKGVFVGTGVKVINRLLIGGNTVIGAGAVVVTDLPSNVTAVGVPAKIIKAQTTPPKW